PRPPPPLPYTTHFRSLPAAEYPALPRLAVAYSRRLENRGIRMEVLCRCRRRFLLLVYRPELLERCLRSPRVSGLLEEAGYPAGADRKSTRLNSSHVSL